MTRAQRHRDELRWLRMRTALQRTRGWRQAAAGAKVWLYVAPEWAMVCGFREGQRIPVGGRSPFRVVRAFGVVQVRILPMDAPFVVVRVRA